MVEVQPVHATGEVERTDERALVGEQSTIDEVGGSAVLWKKLGQQFDI